MKGEIMKSIQQQLTNLMGEALCRGKEREFKAQCKILDMRLYLLTLELKLALCRRGRIV